ncbi:MAG: formate dehydrogenase accessory sulfurtransferase FdhD [Acidobacteria bacterium]|nr:formate dehydrogenase accessory sulfurtransferase FdhD [Acidobacteriota bacterium]
MDEFRDVSVVRLRDGVRTTDRDLAATEEPLEIRLHGRAFAVVMRTPGADRELAAGFLFSERVLTGADDLAAIERCPHPSAEHPDNILDVTLAGGREAALDELLSHRRQVMTNASCGMCGRLTIEAVRADTPAIDSRIGVAAATLGALPSRLREAQGVFDRTGGLHAAGLFTADGGLEDAAEDIGRHNAVDKVIGRRLLGRALPLSDRLLCVSGRTSFEIVQKAALAGIPVVAAVSAPTTLAIDLAAHVGVTLVGFVRDGGFNVYTHPARVR